VDLSRLRLVRNATASEQEQSQSGDRRFRWQRQTSRWTVGPQCTRNERSGQVNEPLQTINANSSSPCFIGRKVGKIGLGLSFIIA
jgi:hypothetical protein